MAEDTSKSLTSVAINTLSDPVVLLSTGGSVFIAVDSPIAGAINLTTVFLSGSVRAVNELKKEGYEINTPEALAFLFESKGGSQITAGGIKMGAALDAARIIDVSQPQSFLNFGGLVGSGLANLSRGFSFNTAKGSALNKTLDITGITAPAVFYSFASPEAPEVLIAGYAASSLLAIDRSLRADADYIVRQPELMMAGTLLASAAMSSDPNVIFASVLWGAGYVSQDMLKKHGGVVEGV